MPLFNLRRTYEMKAICYNCGHKFIIKIPMGITAIDFLNTDKCRCENCNTDDIGINVPGRKDKNGLQEKEKSSRRRRIRS